MAVKTSIGAQIISYIKESCFNIVFFQLDEHFHEFTWFLISRNCWDYIATLTRCRSHIYRHEEFKVVKASTVVYSRGLLAAIEADTHTLSRSMVLVGEAVV